MNRDGIGAVLTNRRFTLYLASRFTFIVAVQMLSVAVGWQVYEITGQALALGFSGLAVFLPSFVLALPGGQLADLRDRRRILLTCHFAFATTALVLALLAYLGTKRLAPIYGLLGVFGAIRAFSGPAGQALMPSLVPREQLGRAVSLSSSGWQLAMILGPAIGGVVYAATARAYVVYVTCAVLALLAFLAVFAMRHVPEAEARRRVQPNLSTFLAGLSYVWSNKVILGAISLDLFAVLFGGTVALLPIFARDLLEIGPWGLGTLRSAPAIGATTVALWLAGRPLRRRAGTTMFVSVLLFGLATVAFGLSRNVGLSLVALIALGAADMVSVVIRSTLVQIRTPDSMRGRVGAVNMVFIGASNELGEFESGVTAALLGPVAAVVLGGLGTCLIVATWALLFPALRKVDRLDEGAAE